MGLLVGYILGGCIIKFGFDKTWEEAFSARELILGLAGIAFTLFIIAKRKIF